ncbi:MAG TPA: tyrosine-type recombinase/integrase, partial [Cyclobacteriaceae bacterium]
LKQSGIQSGKLFPNLPDKYIENLAKTNFRKLGLLSGDAKYTSHSLRHSAGQIMYDKKIPLEFIQMTLRHAKMETTLVYAQKAIDRSYFKSMPHNI